MHSFKIEWFCPWAEFPIKKLSNLFAAMGNTILLLIVPVFCLGFSKLSEAEGGWWDFSALAWRAWLTPRECVACICISSWFGMWFFLPATAGKAARELWTLENGNLAFSVDSGIRTSFSRMCLCKLKPSMRFSVLAFGVSGCKQRKEVVLSRKAKLLI